MLAVLISLNKSIWIAMKNFCNISGNDLISNLNYNYDGFIKTICSQMTYFNSIRKIEWNATCAELYDQFSFRIGIFTLLFFLITFHSIP